MNNTGPASAPNTLTPTPEEQILGRAIQPIEVTFNDGQKQKITAAQFRPSQFLTLTESYALGLDEIGLLAHCYDKPAEYFDDLNPECYEAVVEEMRRVNATFFTYLGRQTPAFTQLAARMVTAQSGERGRSGNGSPRRR